MYKPSLALALVAVILAGCGEDEAVVNPPISARNGNLFFTQVRDGSIGTVESAAQDGGGRRTVIPANGVVTSVSPLGRMLVLTLDTTTDVRLMMVTDLNGAPLDTISVPDAVQIAALSPDAKKVCYGYWDYMNSPNQNFTLHLVNSDGTGDITVPVNAAWESVVAFSPDSRRLAFYSDEDSSLPNKLYIVNSDGTGLKMLNDQAESLNDNLGGLCWSPGSDKVLYTQRKGTSGGEHDIWSIGVDGGGNTNLTYDIDDSWMPNVSPDGRTVVFSAPAIDGKSVDLWTMKADGSDKRNVTKTATRLDMEFKAQWSPDGTKIAYISFDLQNNDNITFGRPKVLDVATGGTSPLASTSDVFNVFWSTAP